MSRRRFLCLDCRVDTGRSHEFYMLENDVWLSVCDDRNGMLCIGCLETRLGRTLICSDFADVHVNRPSQSGQSDRLRARLSVH